MPPWATKTSIQAALGLQPTMYLDIITAIPWSRSAAPYSHRNPSQPSALHLPPNPPTAIYYPQTPPHLFEDLLGCRLLGRTAKMTKSPTLVRETQRPTTTMEAAPNGPRLCGRTVLPVLLISVRNEGVLHLCSWRRRHDWYGN